MLQKRITWGISDSNFARPGSSDPGQKRGFAPQPPQSWGEGGRAILGPLGMGVVVLALMVACRASLASQESTATVPAP